MKKISLLAIVFALVIIACGTSKNSQSTSNIKDDLDEKNRGQISLLTKIRQLPGVTLQNGVPVVTKTTATASRFDRGEPLYVLNGQVIGDSFGSINQLIDNYNVKKVKLLAGSDASYYGAQGAKGVIVITTYQ